MDQVLRVPRQSGLPHDLLQQLRRDVRGEVYNRDDTKFGQQTRLWNGNIICLAKVLVCPVDAQDISRIVQFCTKHGLSLSVKAGGYAVAGWAVAGDVIIDLCLLNDIHIEPPKRTPTTPPTGSTPPAASGSAHPDGPLAAATAGEQKPRKARDWTSLHDRPAADVTQPSSAPDKGKARATPYLLPRADSSIGVGGKRARTPDAAPSSSPSASPAKEDSAVAGEQVKRRKEEASSVERLSYDGASLAAARFLRSGALPPDPRLAPEHRQPPTSSQPPPPTMPGTPRPSAARRGVSDVSTRTPVPEDRDPFGYMFDGPPAPPSVSVPPPTFRAQNGRSGSASARAPNPPPAGGADVCGPSDDDKKEGRPVSDKALAALPTKTRIEAAATTTALPDGDTPLPPPEQFARQKVAARKNGAGAVDKDVDPFAYLAEDVGEDGAMVEAAVPSSRGTKGGTQPETLTMSPMAIEGRTPSTGPSSAGTSSGREGSSGRSGHSASSASASSTDLPADASGMPAATLPPVPLHAHAYVTFGAGMKQREVDMFCDTHRLQGREGGKVPYHVPFAAHPVGSAVMMTGGFGFLSRLYGLSVDALVEVEMVMADGRVLVVSEDEHPDLWWAIRGGGPAFGIATRYKARAFPVPMVFAGNLIYRFHRATAPSLLKHFRDCVKTAPRELYANVLLTAGPADQDSIVVIQLCYVGAREKGMACLQALSAWDGADCLLNDVDDKSFVSQQDSVAQVLRGQHGRKWFIRSTLVTSLPDDIIHQTVNEFADTPIGCTWLFELSGGALADHTDNALNPAVREAAFTVAALHQWEVHVDDPRCKTSAEKWVHSTLRSVSTNAPFTCFLGRGEPFERVRGCFGENWERLVETKRRYDPTNVFKYNYWPLDAEGNVVEAGRDEPGSP